MAEKETPLQKHGRSRQIQMILVPGIQSMYRWVWKFFWLSTTNVIKDKLYWNDTGKSLASWINFYMSF